MRENRCPIFIIQIPNYTRKFMSQPDKLLDDINAALEPYVDDVFDNLLDVADALLDQFLEYEKVDENEKDDDDEFFDGSGYEERAQPIPS